MIKLDDISRLSPNGYMLLHTSEKNAKPLSEYVIKLIPI